MKRKDLFNNEDATSPKSSNATGAYGTFYYRDVYDSFVFRDAKKDLWYKDTYYGRVNQNKEAVIASERNLKQLANNEETILALPPVAAAWSDLVSYIEKAKFRGDMTTENTLFAKMKPVLGWESAHKYYSEYNNAMYDSFSGKFMSSARDRKIKDFDGFLQVFLEFAENTFLKLPWTREGYLLSNRGTPHFSGMCIQFAEAPHDLDSLKARFISDKNFKFFNAAAERHGFHLDRNAPWRLIADLESRGMKRYMKRAGTSGKTFYDDYFVKCYEWELQNFKHYLWGWYNNYVNANPTVQVVNSSNGRTGLDLMVRESYTEEQLFDRYSDHFFIKLYVYIRAMEVGKSWSQSTYDSVVYKARDFLRLKGLNTAMKYVHRSISPCTGEMTKQLFDKKDLTGSQSDAILRQRKKQNKLSFSYY